ncbi:MAG: imidazole glycerol phosphate synthase subunit HisF [Patescibacteria group bacterium]
MAKRIIACMDIDNGRVVKGINFKNLKDAGDPVKLGELYSRKGIDELIFLDVTATIENRKTLRDLVERISEKINIPFTVGGGIKTLQDIRELLKRGADKVSIGSEAIRNPSLVKKAAKKFGSQCIVISIDPKWNKNYWEMYINGGRTPTAINAIKFAKEMERLGAGELLINSLDKDGKKTGYDTKLLKSISEAVNIPVIASSGAGEKTHFLEAFTEGKADAALAATLFHYRKLEIQDLKKYLKKNNVNIRS